MAKPKKIGVKIEGPGVSLGSVQPLAALEVALTYFAMLEEIVAEEIGDDFVLRGLALEDASAGFYTFTEQETVAVEAAARLADFARGTIHVPGGLRVRWKEFGRAVSALPPNQQVTALVSSKKFAVRPEPESPAPTPGEFVTLRAELIRIGGKRARARFEAESEPRPFTIDIETAVARDLSRFLYTRLDITAKVVRNTDGFIADGSLREFRPLAGGGVETLRSWWQAHGRDTTEITDLEREIRPDDDD